MTLPVRNNRIRLPQGQIFWREVGQGQSVVFLHGAWWTGEQWAEVIPPLSHHYHCVVPDLLGFGESGHPKTHYSIQLEVECLAAYLTSLRIKRCVLVADGLGAWVAAAFALAHPDAVAGMVLMAPEGVTSEKLEYRWRGWGLLSSPVPLVDWVLRVRMAIARLLKKQPSSNGRSPQNTIRLRRLLRQNPTACQLLFKRRRTELHSEYLQDRLTELHPPILVLQGEQDTPNTIALAQMYAQAPHATVEVVPILGSPEPWTQSRNTLNLDTTNSKPWAEGCISKAIAPVIHHFLERIF